MIIHVFLFQVDEWVNRNIDDLPKILDSNSPVKKRWGDVDQVIKTLNNHVNLNLLIVHYQIIAHYPSSQAKAIDSIKRALVQITTSYKKDTAQTENPPPASTTSTCVAEQESSGSLKNRGILTSQQPRYDTMVGFN